MGDYGESRETTMPELDVLRRPRGEIHVVASGGPRRPWHLVPIDLKRNKPSVADKTVLEVPLTEEPVTVEVTK